MGGSCVFAGFQEEPLPFLDAMDIVALTSEGEGLPRVLLEAMLAVEAGRSHESYRVRGSLVVDGETGLLVPFGDKGKLDDALGCLAADAAERDRMGRKGRERVLSEYTVEKYVRGVEDVFQEVIGR